jgi:radical SAM superfamily enzyme YgiQ (UPF0313 family)
VKQIDVALVHPTTETPAALANTLAGSEHLGLAYLAAALARAGRSVEIFDLEGSLNPEKEILRLMDLRPAIVGFSPTSASSSNAIEVMAQIRQQLPESLFLWGGHLATGVGPRLLNEVPQLDGVVVGEGERIFPALVDVWIRNQKGLAANNIHWRTGIELSHRIPILGPSWDNLFPVRGKSIEQYRTTGARVLSSMGCPFDCSFCTTPGFSNRRVTRRSVSHLVAEMVALNRDLGVWRFWFNDDIFLDGSRSSRERAWEFAERLIEELPGVRYRVLCRVDTIVKDESLLAQLMRSGLDAVYVGLESGSDTVLAELSKRSRVADNVQSVQKLRTAGLFIQPGFIMFTATTTHGNLRENVRFLVEAGLLYRAFPLTRTALAFPGAALWKDDAMRFDHTRSTSFLRYPKFEYSGVESLSVIMEEVEIWSAQYDSKMYARALTHSLSELDYKKLSGSLTSAMNRLIDAAEAGSQVDDLRQIARSEFEGYFALASSIA